MIHFEGQDLLAALSILLDSAAAWLFCCVISVFLLPLVVDRIVFYIPKLIGMKQNKEVISKSVSVTVVETLLWIGIIGGVYLYLYVALPHLFALTTTSPAALIAWGIAAMHFLYRLINFDRVVKRGFYYGAYMRFIAPEALNSYQQFIEDLDDLYIDDLDMLLKKNLPYMHRQAVLRKKREVTRK